MKRKIAVLIGSATVVLAAGVGTAACSATQPPVASGGSTTWTPVTSVPLPVPSTQIPSVATPVKPAPTSNAPVLAATQEAAPAGSVSQRNAVRKAESYLSYTAFSRTGLIKQLEYEGFTKADATYAVDHVTVDWTEQADKKAKSYMEYSSFSRSGLVKQLKYEGFTQAQAEHGATSVGL